MGAEDTRSPQVQSSEDGAFTHTERYFVDPNIATSDAEKIYEIAFTTFGSYLTGTVTHGYMAGYFRAYAETPITSTMYGYLHILYNRDGSGARWGPYTVWPCHLLILTPIFRLR